MKTKNLTIIISILIGFFLISGCYTIVKLEDDEYSYKKERKRVIIEKKGEKDGEKEYETVDTTYEATDDEASYDDEDRYYYPKHRRAYKYYHPGITVIINGVVFYDPWYFDYFYYPYAICRTYYLPWWYGYYSCYRVWWGFAFYDPFYNPFYVSPYWWYDPYWYGGGYYPPIIQYRKNDYTRLRNQDGGRSGSIITGNWGRDLNLQIANKRTQTRDLDRNILRGATDRTRRTVDINSNVPSLRNNDRSIERDRNTKTQPPIKPNDRNIEKNRQKDPPLQKPKTPTEREGTKSKVPDRNLDRPNLPRDGNDTPQRKRYDSYIPGLDKEILIERNYDRYRIERNNLNSRNLEIDLERYDSKKNIIEYEVPRREFIPRFERKIESNSKLTKQSNDEYIPNNNNDRKRNDYPFYQSPRYESPRYESPSRNNLPSFTPRITPPPPTRTPAPSNDRGRQR